jgi:hypothetical protein
MLDPEALQASLTEWIATRCGASRVEVRWLGVDASRLPESGVPRWEGEPCRGNPRVRLTVVDDGVAAWTGTIQPRIDLWAPGFVAAKDLSPGARVEAVPAEVPFSAAPTVDVGVTRVPLTAGEPLSARVVDPLADLPAGAAVVLVSSVGALSIRAPGTLLHAGVIGQPVRVVNQATHAALAGTLVDAQTVELLPEAP